MATATASRKPTRKQVAAYIRLVEEHGRKRRANFGNRFRVEDYLAGAMVWFFTEGVQDQLPASWTFGLMAGKDPLGD